MLKTVYLDDQELVKLKTLCRAACIARLDPGFVDHETSIDRHSKLSCLQSLTIGGIHREFETFLELYR